MRGSVMGALESNLYCDRTVAQDGTQLRTRNGENVDQSHHHANPSTLVTFGRRRRHNRRSRKVVIVTHLGGFNSISYNCVKNWTVEPCFPGSK